MRAKIAENRMVSDRFNNYRVPEFFPNFVKLDAFGENPLLAAGKTCTQKQRSDQETLEKTLHFTFN
jgi:hypothetical protein